jgi:hypothetical protein
MNASLPLLGLVHRLCCCVFPGADEQEHQPLSQARGIAPREGTKRFERLFSGLRNSPVRDLFHRTYHWRRWLLT